MKKGSHHSSATIEKQRLAKLGKTAHPNTVEATRKRMLENNPMKKEGNREIARNRMLENNPMQDPDVAARSGAGKKGIPHSDERREKERLATIAAQTDTVRAKKIASHKDVPLSQEHRDAISRGKMGIPKSEEHRRKIGESRMGKYTGEENGFYGKRHSEENIQKFRECTTLLKNDIWYGGVKYPDDRGRIYCEKWNVDLRNRIRVFWGYKSPLSGKTKEENRGRSLDCHHVYFQKKACCHWDEDSQGYYAIVDGEKYYIKGDPNKFVPLTRDEHTRILSNKLHWIKFFEDLIEENGGKSYFTKEEMSIFKKLLKTES